MRALHFILAFSLLGADKQATSQHQADKWYFGYVGDGLDFTHQGGAEPGCDPDILTNGAIEGFEGVSCIADPTTGELLFYTNSDRIWDRSHTSMPNGHIRPGGVWQNQNTISQVLIIPLPGSDSLFYVFTNQIQCSFGGFGMRLAAVDMSLNGGMGDVTFKDVIVFADTVAEKVTAVRHANGQDIWVIGHAGNDDRFFALLVTSSGITGPAVISAIGKHHGGMLSMDCIGEMKASPDGTMLAVATYSQPDIELFHFDNATGVISDAITIAAPSSSTIASYWFGVCFSPDNSKLYAGRRNFNMGWPSIIQVDVSAYDSALINASKDTISTLQDVWSLQLAPNGKIYTCRSGNYLGAINNPNADGLACDFDPQAVDFGHAPGGFDGVWGFNNYIALEDYPCIGGTAVPEGPGEPIGLTVLPGLTPGMFTVTATTKVFGTLHLGITDMRGARVFTTSQATQDGSGTIDLRHLDAGIYLFSAFVGTQHLGACRIVLTE